MRKFLVIFLILIGLVVGFFVQKKRHLALSKDVPAQYELEEKRWTAAVELATFLSYIRKGHEGETAVSQIHRLLEQSQNDDPRIRQYLVLTLGVIADPNSEALLIKLIQDEYEDLQVRIYAMRSLASLQSEHAQEALLPLCHHYNPEIRKNAFYALGQLKNIKLIKILNQGLRDPNHEVKKYAAIALAQLRVDTGKTILMEALNEPGIQGTEKILIIDALQQIENKEIHIMIRPSLYSEKKQRLETDAQVEVQQKKNNLDYDRNLL